jgi:hypothetical protein
MRDPDILETVYRAALAGRPLADIRREVGGQRVYIPARPRREHLQPAERLRAASLSPAEAAARYGISERHAYRLRRLG